MQKIVIEGGRPLKGEVTISGAKNSALPILFATVLADGPVMLRNVPELEDIQTTLKILQFMGAKHSNGYPKSLKIQPTGLKHCEAPYELVKTMRASVLAMGPLLGRFHQAKVSLPGGCAIGARPINLHLKAFEQMGAKIEIEGGYVNAHVPGKKRLQGAKIHFDTITVTGTENVMMAAALAKGQTVIENAAREPEIPDLANILNKMGAKVYGAGTETIVIDGVDDLKGAEHSIISDRIEAGTFMIGAAMTGGSVTLRDTESLMVEALTAKLEECGAKVTVSPKDGSIKVEGPAGGAKNLKSSDITTAPYPGFATDFQAQYMAMMTVSQGTSVISETIFENRFMHALEMKRMGADIQIEGHRAIVKGVKKLSGAPVMASDLRASAALLLAGLVADGLTEVHRVYHIDRGYENIEKKFRALGARVKRAKVKY
ncbi:MAG TPA: UDP-N-acetylglucosamine 1-carboxyvinyltransferase [bacterium]|nr:UDP-N-acetylglucosamine 1-carboxyvinyltransferase [bacterium]